jgi:hypothetical protein
MRRLRNGGTQVIRVERIEVSDNAHAIQYPPSSVGETSKQ